MKTLLSILLLFVPLGASFAEDIELYVGNNVQRAGEKPQVLIIFDTSGSMGREETIKSAYEPNIDYGSNSYIYYSKDSEVPTINSSSKFLIADNGCNSSVNVLAKNGFYTGKLNYYRPEFYNKNNKLRPAKWRAFGSGTLSSTKGHYIDCEEDVININLKNASGVPDGLPSNDNINVKNPPPYALAPNSYPSFDTGVNLYSSNYVQWYHNAAETTRSRMEIAQETVTNLIQSAPGVIFGLQVFNQNNSSSTNGGRISYGIKKETGDDAYDKDVLVKMINEEVTANGNTPLCETLYEAALYFGGKTVKYGDSGGSKKPLKDNNVSTSSVYNSPFAGCSNEIFVILMTDGVPVQDTAADDLVDDLIKGASGSRLDDLADWMHNNDINNKIEGTQTATTFTIGFGKDAVDNAGVLLTDTANKGGGKYYPAENATDLLTSLQSALLEILKESTSFTSPSIASNNFDRTETLDSVYYAMFLPDRGPRWLGNLKKLKIAGDQQLDRTGAVAINASGNIANSAKTFWSTDNEADGPDVNKGGVADMLRSKTGRKLYSDIGSSGALKAFNYANVLASSNLVKLAEVFNSDPLEIEDMIKWASGIDVDDYNDDGDFTDTRHDVFGDPLHSKPLVVNYGGTRDNQDVRIIVGTNAGFIHMFEDKGNIVDETWAFIPQELYDNIPILRENSTSSAKVYGIDGTPTVHLIDKNGDGSVNANDGDKAWLFFGLRRGGSSYYAIDISYPDNPKMMWHINDGTQGFSEFGQSWSKIKIGYSKINIVSGEAKPVAFISGGYDTNKDIAGPAQNDSYGRAIYIVDAESGALKWSASPASSSSTNLKWSGINDSIPSSLATMDSDADGLVDRIYAGDAGGNVWRIDMPGADPNSSVSPWTIHHLAEFGGESNNNDLRFFNEPTIARAIITDTVSTTTELENGETEITISRFDKKYDAVLLGSGDRTTPTAKDTSDKFFMIKDPEIFTRSFGYNGHEIPSTITTSALYDFTDNPYGNVSTSQAKESLDLAVSQKSGWYVNYVGSGEKSVSTATVVAGVAYFNSFTPATTSGNNLCNLSAGIGKLYAVDLATGSTVYKWRSLEIGDRVPDTPTIVIPPEPPTEDTNGDGVIDENDKSESGKLRFVGVGSGADVDGDAGTGTITLCDAVDCDPVEGIKLETMRTHLYIKEE